MNINRLTATLFVILLLTGCQQAQMSASKPVNGQSVTNQTIRPESANAIVSQRKTDTPSNISGNSDEITAKKTCEKNPVKTSAIPKEADQKKIDQALELCNFAQDMWEEGNLEEALANLDSAYFLILRIDHPSSPELS